MTRVFALLALTAAMAAPALAQSTAPAPPTSPPLAQAEAPSKACTAAIAKATREQHALEAATAQAARDTKARESCGSKTACARYDSAIAGAQKRATQHEARLRKFKAAQAKACKS